MPWVFKTDQVELQALNISCLQFFLRALRSKIIRERSHSWKNIKQGVTFKKPGLSLSGGRQRTSTQVSFSSKFSHAWGTGVHWCIPFAHTGVLKNDQTSTPLLCLRPIYRKRGGTGCLLAPGSLGWLSCVPSPSTRVGYDVRNKICSYNGCFHLRGSYVRKKHQKGY